VTRTCLERYPATEVGDGPNIGPTPISWVCRYSDAVRLPGLVDHNPEPLVAATVRPEPGGVVVLRRFVLSLDPQMNLVGERRVNEESAS
jgi:hypothetical protein